MSEFRIDKITNRDGSVGTQICGVTTFSGTSGMQLPVGATEYRGGRGRVVVSGGFGPSIQSTMDKFEIGTTGNATSFGNMPVNNAQSAMVASSTRGVIGDYSTPSASLAMYYFTFPSEGGVSSFGDLTTSRFNGQGSGNNIRGLFYGGSIPTAINNIDYITIATQGDASDFGDIATNSGEGAGDAGRTNISSPTRGIFCIDAPGSNNTLEMVTIATRGNGTKFGELRSGRMGETSGSSNSIRGVCAGGYAHPTTIDDITYITLATEGNGVDFGNLVNKGNQASSAASPTRMVIMGIAYPAGGIGDTIQYITIASTGNATDFGDMTANRAQACANSNAHGGLG